MVRAIKGMLIECDASIKSIIVNINDNEGNTYIIEDLDEEHLVIQESKVQDLKRRLEDHLKETIPEVERDSDSDRDIKDDKKKGGW